MRKIIIGIVLLLVLLIGGLLILPSLIPSSVYKEKIQTQLSRELDRPVIITGDVTLKVFPTIRAEAGRVDIKNPDGFTADTFASMDGLLAQVKLLPLFSKQVEISAFTLQSPEINLETRRDGVSNWTFGNTDTANDTKSDKGPFKRDGRFDTVNPKIGDFRITDGRISYVNLTSNTSVNVTDVTMAFSVPSLDQAVSIDGSLTVNGQALILDATLDTPRAFLRGESAAIDGEFKADFAALDIDGAFLPGEDIAAAVTIDGRVSDIPAALSLLPDALTQDIPYTQFADTIDMAGDYRFENAILSAKGASISVKSDTLDAQFDGDARLGKTPILNGTIKATSSDTARIIRALQTDGLIPSDLAGTDIIRDADINADFASQGDGFTAETIRVTLSGPDARAEFTGSGRYGDALSLKGNFDVDADNIATLATALNMMRPEIAALDSGTAKGTLSLNGDNVSIALDTAALRGRDLTADYTGTVSKSGDTIGANGQFKLDVPSLNNLAQTASIDTPYAASVGALSASGSVSGSGTDFAVTNLTARLSDGALNGQYDGRLSVSQSGDYTLSGQAALDIPSLRTLAANTGTVLPASTNVGPIYEAFSVTGALSGTTQALDFSGAKLAFDDLSGAGDFKVVMTNARPMVTGRLDMAGLDLRPYMAAYAKPNPTGAIEPWSTEPINLGMLRTVDAKLTIATPTITTDRLNLGETTLSATLENGRLAATLPNLGLYGGLGNLTARVDASGAVPVIALDADLSKLNSESFLGAVAGFAKASGEGGTTVSITGSGNNQAAIMQSLSGSGTFKLLNGAISGVDLGAFMTGLESALTQRTLPNGLGPRQSTQFQDLLGQFSIENGVATIGDFTLSGNGIAASGAGKIDLGGQTIDFSLRPRATGEGAAGLAALGIPIQLKGGFGSVSAGLDTDLLGRIVAERAQARARDALTSTISDKIGGERGDVIGGIIGGVLGGGNAQGNQSQDDQSTKGPEDNEPASDTPSTDDAIGQVLGGLLGGSKPAGNTPAPTPQPVPESSSEGEIQADDTPSIEDAIGGLFGLKKKNESSEDKTDSKPDE